MFNTLKNGFCAVALAAVVAVGAATGANAALINIDPGDSNVLVIGNQFLTGDELKASGESFSDTYFFFLPEQTGADGFEAVFYGFDVTFQSPQVSNFGIADLTFTVFDVTNGNTLNTVVMTDGNGFGPGGAFNFTGNWPAPIDLTLTVTGTALSNGGSYNATVAAVPLPAPLLLFVSALVGLGFLGRRRMSA